MGRRALVVALALFAFACAFVVQSPGWAQTSYMALSRALSGGTATIDRWHWETHDVAYADGHYYSVKPPGLVLATLPLYAALDGAGAERVARQARIRAESGGAAPWAARTLPVEQYGYSRARAIAARAAIADDAPLTWALGLLGVLAPALALLVLVARGADRIAAGTGVAAALTLGAGTLVLPFSTLYFSHVLSALLGFAAFMLVWRERSRGAGPRPPMLALAGLLAGLAVVCEYPLGITALIVGAYALLPRRPGLVRRALHYGGGLAAGVAPLLAYQWWAFGSPLHMTYANAVAETGRSGHDQLGLNDGGFFGITVPRPGAALELLFSGRGLLTLAPVLVLAIAGIVALARERGGRHRAEGLTIAAIALAYFVYNAGYWLPLGGGSPGPRFLFPILPFLALGLAVAWRRWTAVTLGLAVVSTTTMVTATLSYPMIGVNDPGEWLRRMFDGGIYQHTILDLAGVAHGPASVLPFAIAIAVALAIGVGTLGRAQLARGARWAPGAIAAWALCATVLPRPLRLPSEEAMALNAVAGLIGLLAVALVALPLRRRSAQHEEHHGAAPRALEVQPAQRSG